MSIPYILGGNQRHLEAQTYNSTNPRAPETWTRVGGMSEGTERQGDQRKPPVLGAPPGPGAVDGPLGTDHPRPQQRQMAGTHHLARLPKIGVPRLTSWGAYALASLRSCSPAIGQGVITSWPDRGWGHCLQSHPRGCSGLGSWLPRTGPSVGGGERGGVMGGSHTIVSEPTHHSCHSWSVTRASHGAVGGGTVGHPRVTVMGNGLH